MFDLFFISYFEPLSQDNWQRLKLRFIHAKHISGIEGIDLAHKKAAQQSNTSMFYTVDADTVIDEAWDFSFIPPDYDKKFLHLWYSRNPVNNLEYGYAGVKLWPKQAVLDYQSPWLDFTTGVGNLKIMQDVISTSCFNTSEYETWKSAFRESIKLSKNIQQNEHDTESKKRLNTWTSTCNNVKFAEWCLKGARDGIDYFKANKNLSIINDFNQLLMLFQQNYKIT